MDTKKVWYITGASKGLGLSLVKKLMSEGYSVAATSRNKESLVKAVGEFDKARFLPLETDLTNEASVVASIHEARDYFGTLDVVVNNAGYGIGGAVEELNQKEIHDSFDVNAFAVINVMKAVTPILREQKSGYIINISSIAGFAPGIGWSIYAAAKFALMGLTEIFAEDVKEFGIKATVVAPGAFRTDFLTKESLVFADNKIEAYTAVAASHKKYEAMSGSQLGDPDKAADVFIKLAAMEHPPVQLFLGSDAYNRAQAKIEALEKNLEDNKNISFSTDYSKA